MLKPLALVIVFSFLGLYIFYNGSALAKVLIGASNTYQWAYQGNAASWNGV